MQTILSISVILSFKPRLSVPYYFVAVRCMLACYMHAPVQDVRGRLAYVATAGRLFLLMWPPVHVNVSDKTIFICRLETVVKGPHLLHVVRFVATEETMSLFTVKW